MKICASIEYRRLTNGRLRLQTVQEFASTKGLGIEETPEGFSIQLLETAEENKSLKYEDTVEEEKYNTLKRFFESTIEQDDYTKLKDGYTVLDSKTNICYFKRNTLADFLDKRKTPFKTVNQAIRLLDCKKHDFFEGERNRQYKA